MFSRLNFIIAQICLHFASRASVAAASAQWIAVSDERDDNMQERRASELLVIQQAMDPISLDFSLFGSLRTTKNSG